MFFFPCMSNNLKPLFGLTLSEIEKECSRLGLPSYAALQIANWLYKNDVSEIEQMSNLSKDSRFKLGEEFIIGLTAPVQFQLSSDGTTKYLFPTLNGRFVEAAYIPEIKRNTLCVSSQVGCRMGCSFCMTATQGFQGNLSAGEILNQIRSLPERKSLTNIVYMGMGEPLDNLDEVLKSIEILTSQYGLGISPKRITVSTIGIVPAIKVFLEKSACNLAVSLHSPFDKERQQLMPISKLHQLNDIVHTIKSFNIEKQRRISFEYIVFKGLNHSRLHANELAKVLNGIRCRINLLRYHKLPHGRLESPGDEELFEFKELLEKKGLITTVRKSRGLDIDAACGLLSTKKANQQNSEN